MLNRLEAALRAAFESVGYLLPGKLQPLELAVELERALRESEALSPDGAYVANSYSVHLSPEDFERFAGFREDLERELTSHLRAYCAENGLTSGPRLSVRLRASERIRPGHSRVTARFDQRPLPARLTVIAGEDAPAGFEIVGQAVIGRDDDCQVMLADRTVSRRHAQLWWTYAGYRIRDLNSTNGTSVNGAAITDRLLTDGDLIGLGSAQARFACHPGLAEPEDDAQTGGME